MDLSKNEISLFLPKYLSPETQTKLLKCLEMFPKLKANNYFSQTSLGDGFYYQGDIIDNILVINLPNMETVKNKVMLVSSTCDMDLNNIKQFPINITYAPLMPLKNYIRFLNEKCNLSDEKIKHHIDIVKNQEIFQLFYLPNSPELEESIVFLDKMNSIQSNSLNRANINNERVKTLSQFGHYLLVFKLSVHFTRITENIDRGINDDVN